MCILAEILFNNNIKRRDPDRRSQRIAAEGRTVVTGSDHLHDVVITGNCRDGIESAAQRLTHD